MNKRAYHTKEFKLEAIRLLETSDKNGSELARELGFRRNQLYKWKKEFDDKGETAFGGAGRRPISNDKVALLKRENERLREEVEILKKAAAYFARDMK